MQVSERILDAVEIDICEALDNLVDDSQSAEWSNSKWTSELKSAIAHIGQVRKYFVYAHSAENVDGGEWLFDLCWLKYKDRALQSTVLA